MLDTSGMIGWGHYDGIQGFGSASARDVSELAKALRAGADINSPGAAAGVGFPLRVESLESTLKVTTFRAQDILFWKQVPKVPAYNTIEEFNRLNAYGDEEGIFIGEGDLPGEDDSTYERAYTIIRFLGTTRRVTHPMNIVRAPHGSVIAQETLAGTLKILRSLEVALFGQGNAGDSSLIPVAFDGFERKFIAGVNNRATGAESATGSAAWNTDVTACATANLMQDMRGNPVSEDVFTDLTGTIAEDPNHGTTTDVYYGFGPHRDFSKLFYPRERANGLVHEGAAGVVVNSWNSPFGKVKLNPDKWIRPSAALPAAGTGDAARRPAAPTVTLLAAAGGATPGFGATVQGRVDAAAAGAGNYRYRVVAINRFGRSAASAAIAAVAVVAGDQANITVQDNSPPGTTTGYDIYRSEAGGAAGTERYVFSAQRTAALQVIADVNRFLPGNAAATMNRAYFLQQNLEALAWKQLLPFLKVPLAQIDLTIRWAQILYGAFELYAPRKHGMIINAGRLP